MKRLVLSTLTALSLGLAALAPSHAADIREHSIKFASQNNKGHPQVIGMQKFADLVAQKSGNKIRVRLFPGGVLGGDLETVSALQGGTIEMTVLNSGILQAQVKDFAAYDFPFLFNNDKEVDALVDGPFGHQLHEKLRDKGLVGLAYFDLGFRNITNAKHPITKPEDIAGLKLRVIQSPIYVDVFKALGANPTPLAWPEVYNALEQGAVDGQENPFTVILNAKLDEVQKYLAVTRHIYNPQSVIISKKFWDTLNADEQKLIQDAATEAAAYQRGVSRDAASKALATLKNHGMQVTEMSPADMDKMRAMVKPVVEKYAQEVGQATVQSMYAELDKIRQQQQ
ncbi:MAG TPA: TRAP transporter substrate-binding protein [Castellaniella sp.]|nr:TRAP transporter substrate-binding protein [Castellaniella sp.]